MAEVLRAGESPAPEPQRRIDYDAFLSYAHRDKDVTSAIQKGLHQIGRRVGQLRALRVFRDDTNLTANPDLWAKITEALHGSRYMIVVLSPQAAASHWVNEEIRHWLEHYGYAGLMLVLAEGYLQWDAMEARFNPERSNAAPPVLTEPGSLPAEPLFIDVSADAPWELRSLVFRDKVTSLAAPIHGKPKDGLTGDDLREQRRFRRLRLAAIAGLAVLTVIAVVTASIALVQRTKAIREARDALAAQLDTEASTVFSRFSGDSDAQALAETLAARRIRSHPSASSGAFYTAIAALNNTRIIIPTPAAMTDAAISPDGHTLASASNDATIRLWDITDPAHAKPLGRPLTNHTSAVLSVAFEPDGRTLASASLDHTVRLWSLMDLTHPVPLGQLVSADKFDFALSVAFSPDGHTMASANRNSTIQLWDFTDPSRPGPLGQPLSGHTDKVLSVAFSADGHTLASASVDRTVRLWDLTDPTRAGPLGQPLTGHTDAVGSVAFSPDGHTLASAGLDATIRLWDLTDPTRAGPLGQPLTGHTDTVSSVAFSPDGHTLASTSLDHTVRLWNLDTALPLRGHTAQVRGVAFSPDGHTLASAGLDGTVRLWDLTDPTRAGPLGQPLACDINVVFSVAFSPDGHTLAMTCGETIRLWDLTNRADPAPLGQPLTDGHPGEAVTTAFSPDGHTLASGGGDGIVQLWDLADLAHPALLGQLRRGDINPAIAAFSQVLSVAFSPDGHTLASGSQDHTIQLWDLADPAHPAPLGQPLTGHTGAVQSVAFSANGHTLASGSEDRTIRLWDLSDLARPGPSGQPLHSHTSAVYSVAFSPDGRTLASGSEDRTIRLWNLTDATHPAALGQPLHGHTNLVFSVAFSPDGHTLASGSDDDTVRLWPTPLDPTVATLCSKLTSNISHHEWRDWISPTIGYLTLCPNLPIAADSNHSAHASLGVLINDDPHGARIVGMVNNGAAAMAGVHVGSVIIKADERTIGNADALGAALKAKAPGDKMTLTYIDPSGAQRTVQVTLETAPGG